MILFCVPVHAPVDLDQQAGCSLVAGYWERGDQKIKRIEKGEKIWDCEVFHELQYLIAVFKGEMGESLHSHTMRQSQQEVNHTMFTKGMQGISRAWQREHIAALGLIAPVSSGGKSQVLRKQNLNYFEVQAPVLDWLCQGNFWKRAQN